MIRRFIHTILDSPILSAGLLAGAYTGIGVAGVAGIVWPHTLADVAFRVPAAAGAWLALIGGLAGAISVLVGMWWLERGAIALMVGAIAARIYSLTYQQVSGAASLGEVAISIAFLTSIMCGLCVRLLYIRGLALDPRHK